MAELVAYDLGDGRTVYRFPKDHGPPKRSDLPTPYVSIDTMDPVQSQLDGKMYDSKSALRATYKAAGVVEVGNDPARLRPKQPTKPDRQEIRKALEKARQKVGI